MFLIAFFSPIYLFLMQSLTRPLAQREVGNVKLSLQNPFGSCLSFLPGPGPVALMTRWTHWSGFLGHFQGYQQPKPISFFSNLSVHAWGTEPIWKAMKMALIWIFSHNYYPKIRSKQALRHTKPLLILLIPTRKVSKSHIKYEGFIHKDKILLGFLGCVGPKDHKF